jgi:microcompartment protein CcmK/EutM
MTLCLVTGTVVASQKSEALRRSRLLIVHPIDAQGRRIGRKDQLALDPGLDAGPGDRVLVAKEGAVVSQLLDPEGAPPMPANVIIIAIVDDWSAEA